MNVTTQNCFFMNVVTEDLINTRFHGTSSTSRATSNFYTRLCHAKTFST